MYLEHDFYLSEYKQNFADDKEAYLFLQKCFPSLSINPVKGSYLSSELCLFAYLFYCYSTGELANAFGNFFSGASVRTRLAELKNKKMGALKSLGFSHIDMGARKAYSITKHGYVSYLSNLPDAIKPSNGQIMIRRSKDLVPVHDYGVGMSLLSFMQLGIPFYYEKEENYTIRHTRKEKGSVCVDCTIYVNLGTEYKLYIELDMGNETTLTLVNKIGSYKHLSMTKPNTRIVFSSHAVMDYSTCPSYKISELELLYEDMMEKGENKVYNYYMEYKDALNESALITITALLVRTGVCVAYRNKYDMEKGITLSAEQITPLSIIRRNMVVTYEMKLEKAAVPSEDMSIMELRRYIDDLSAGTNPYRVKAYNMEQYRIAKQKFRNMCTLLSRYIGKGAYKRDEVLCLLNGYSCYMVPAVLLNNSAKYFLPLNNTFVESHRRALLPYYPNIDKAQYSEVSEAMHFEGYPSISMRNAFKLPDGKLVVLEHIGQDIGGFARCYYLRLLSTVCPDLKLHVVCLCDNDDDMIHFCTFSKYTVKYSRFPANSNFYMSFLVESDVNDKDCLLKGITDLENPIPVYIRTVEQSNALAKYREEQTEREKTAAMQQNTPAPSGLSGLSLAELFQDI